MHPAQNKQHTSRRQAWQAIGIFVVGGLVFFHSAFIFTPNNFFIENEPPISGFGQYAVQVLVFFFTLWGMPLMFFSAGVAIWFSLNKRTISEFILERVQRLLVPFFMGLLFLIPLNQYIIFRHQFPTEAITFVQFLRTFFTVKFDVLSPGFLIGSRDFFTMSHLWFLIYLFASTILLLPIFVFLRKNQGRIFLHKVTVFLARPWAIYLMGLPLAVIQAGLGVTENAASLTWNIWGYLLFLTYGFCYASDNCLEQATINHKRSAFLFGVVGFVLLIGLVLLNNLSNNGGSTSHYSPESILFRFIIGMTGWIWIVGILGFVSTLFRKFLNYQAGESQYASSSLYQKDQLLRKDLIEYVNKAQLPFYVLHITPVILISFLVVQWEINALLKYLIIVLSSLAFTFLLYDIGVRRTRITRFFFGVKQRPKSQEGETMKQFQNEKRELSGT